MADAAAVETESGDAGEVTPETSVNTVLTEGDNAGDQSGDENSNLPDEGDAESSDDGEEGSDTGNEGDDVVPETYADFNLPEGVTMDESMLDEVIPMFKDIGATQEQAQKFIDLQAKQVQAGEQKQVDTFNQLMNDWLDQSKNDGEFGGDKFIENVKIAQSAVTRYGTPELKQLLDDHGVGNHPEMIRFMVRVGHTIKEDTPGESGNNASKKLDRAEVLYPKKDK